MVWFSNKSRTQELDGAILAAANIALGYLKDNSIAARLKAHDKFDRLSEDIIDATQGIIPSYAIALCQITFRQAILDGHFPGLERMPEHKLMGVLNVKFYDTCRKLFIKQGADARTAARLSKQIAYKADIYVREVSRHTTKGTSVAMMTVILNKVFYSSIEGQWTESTTPEEVTLYTFMNKIVEELRKRVDPSYQ